MSSSVLLKTIKKHCLLQMALAASWIIPRTASVCVVGGSKGIRFADNAKHFFVLAHQFPTNIQFVFVSSSHEVIELVRACGYQAFLPHSRLGLWFGFRAKWHVTDVSIKDTSEFTSLGAIRLNLWHGVPLKRLRHPSDNVARPFPFKVLDFFYRSSPKYKYFLNPPKQQNDYISSVFNIPKENIVNLNTPRNDVLLHPEKVTLLRNELDKKLEVGLPNQDNRVIGYFPTWRETGDDQFMGATDFEQIHELNEHFASKGYVLVTKWHSCSHEEYKHRGVSRSAKEISSALERASNIVLLPFETDLNMVLMHCELLISDYSGVILDFIILNRPIILSAYDRQKYESVTGLLNEYTDLFAELTTNDFAETFDSVKAFIENPDAFSNQQQVKREAAVKYFTMQQSGMPELMRLIEGNDSP